MIVIKILLFFLGINKRLVIVYFSLGIWSTVVSVLYLSLAPIFFKLLASSSNNWMLIKIIKLVSCHTTFNNICTHIVHICAPTYTQTQTHRYTHKHTHTYTHTHTNIHTHTHTHIHTHTSTCTHVHTLREMHTCKYTHTHM